MFGQESGHIDTHGAAWAIACGPATSFAGRLRHPPLGRYAPSSCLADRDLTWAKCTPIEGGDAAAMAGFDIEDLHLARYTDVLP